MSSAHRKFSYLQKVIKIFFSNITRKSNSQFLIIASVGYNHQRKSHDLISKANLAALIELYRERGHWSQYSVVKVI